MLIVHGKIIYNLAKQNINRNNTSYKFSKIRQFPMLFIYTLL